MTAETVDLDALEDLTDDEVAEVGAAAARTLETISEGSRVQLGELVQQAVAPQIGQTTRRISELVAGGAYRIIIESDALAQTKMLSELIAGSASKPIRETSALARTNALSGFAESSDGPPRTALRSHWRPV